MSATNPPPRSSPPGIGDLLSLFGSNNPFTALSKTVEQFRSGVTGFIEVVQTFRQTMDNMNAVATRMNRLMDDVEEPIRTVMPQITKSAEAATRMMATLREPVERVSPGLMQLADLLGNPAVTDLPRRLADTMDVMSALPKALGPLSQMADMAGGFFGTRGFPGLSSMTASSRPAATRVPVAERASALPDPDAAAPTTSARRAPAKRAPARRTTKKAAAKRTTAKKAAPRKSSTRTAKSAQSAFERSAAKKTAPSKATARKSTSKRAR